VVLSVGDIGLLKIAIAISGASALVFSILYRVYNKEMRLSIENGNAGESAAISGTVSLFATVFSGALVVTFYFFGEQALRMIFGTEFGDAYMASFILLSGQFAVCCMGRQPTILVAKIVLASKARLGPLPS